MLSSEPSPKILTDRSASFNRAEYNKSMRTKASNAESTWGVESIENLTSVQSSAHHIRHSSLDSSYPSALHPINLNSKFDHLFFRLWPVKAPSKAIDQADTEGSFLSASNDQKEGGGETQEELILEPHESLVQDAQEESFSTSMSAESKSPREDRDFILWGNAAFCLTEARDSPIRNKALGLGRQTGRSFGDGVKKQNHLLIDNHLSSRDESPRSPARDKGLLPCSGLDHDHHLVASTRDAGLSNGAPIVENEESFKCQSSVGSTLSVHDSLTESHTQAQDFAEAVAQTPLMSSEGQSCCLDFNAEDMEASASSDRKPPADTPQEECSSKKISDEGKDDEEEVANISHQEEATQIGGVSPSQSCTEVQQDLSTASEEVKIRAELELEIEKDLEQEIKTKIYLLSRRLEELHVLKATRDPKQEQSGAQMEVGSQVLRTQMEVGSLMPSIVNEAANMVAKVTREAPKSPPPSKSPLNRATLEQSSNGSHAEWAFARATSASSKKQLPSVEKDGLSMTHSNTWRKLAMASGWTPHTKENGPQFPTSDGSLRNIKISKNSIEGLSFAKPKFQVESTPWFKQDYQSWPVSSRAKKFDWIGTLRSDVACTPRVSSMKRDFEDVSPFLPPAKEPLHGHVARTLFSEEGLSAAPLKKTLSKFEREESLMTPLAGSLKRSVFSSSKPHGSLVPLQPLARNISSGHLPHDNAIKSASSAKRVASQKLPSPGIHAPSPVHKTPELRQARIATPSIPRVPSKQTPSNKKTGTVEALSSPTRSLKNVSPTHAEKAKRSASAPPSVPARSANARDSKAALMKTLPSKQVGSLSQTRASRTAPVLKPGTSSTQISSKTRVGVLSDSVGKRPSSTPLKPSGAATRGVWH